MRGLAPVLAVTLAIAGGQAVAQDDRPARPRLLAATGLLETVEQTVRHPVAPDFTVVLPTSEDVDVRAVELPPDESDIVASWEFFTPGGSVIETLTMTTAQIDPAPPLARQFAMANLLVLQSYAQIEARFAEARLLAFGPVPRDDALTAVQTVGDFRTEGGRRLVFRHVGIMAAGRAEALVAILNIDPRALPIRSDAELRDTYAGHALRSLRLVPEETPADPE